MGIGTAEAYLAPLALLAFAGLRDERPAGPFRRDELALGGLALLFVVSLAQSLPGWAVDPARTQPILHVAIALGEGVLAVALGIVWKQYRLLLAGSAALVVEVAAVLAARASGSVWGKAGLVGGLGLAFLAASLLLERTADNGAE